MVVLACCARAPAWQKSNALERSARMLRQLDAIEADLHQGAQDAALYAALVARHGQAEETACRVTDEHVEEIHRLDMVQQEKLRERGAHRRRRLADAGGHAFAAR
jgi:hypothetical protein